MSFSLFGAVPTAIVWVGGGGASSFWGGALEHPAAMAKKPARVRSRTFWIDKRLPPHRARWERMLAAGWRKHHPPPRSGRGACSVLGPDAGGTPPHERRSRPARDPPFSARRRVLV